MPLRDAKHWFGPRRFGRRAWPWRTVWMFATLTGIAPAFSCSSSDPAAVEVVISFDINPVPTSATVEVRLYADLSCDDLRSEAARGQLPQGAVERKQGELASVSVFVPPKSNYTYAALLRDERCNTIGFACAKAVAKDTPQLTLLAEPLEVPVLGCPFDAVCMDSRCVPSSSACTLASIAEGPLEVNGSFDVAGTALGPIVSARAAGFVLAYAKKEQSEEGGAAVDKTYLTSASLGPLGAYATSETGTLRRCGDQGMLDTFGLATLGEEHAIALPYSTCDGRSAVDILRYGSDGVRKSTTQFGPVLGARQAAAQSTLAFDLNLSQLMYAYQLEGVPVVLPLRVSNASLSAAKIASGLPPASAPTEALGVPQIASSEKSWFAIVPTRRSQVGPSDAGKDAGGKDADSKDAGGKDAGSKDAGGKDATSSSDLAPTVSVYSAQKSEDPSPQFVRAGSFAWSDARLASTGKRAFVWAELVAGGRALFELGESGPQPVTDSEEQAPPMRGTPTGFSAWEVAGRARLGWARVREGKLEVRIGEVHDGRFRELGLRLYENAAWLPFQGLASSSLPSLAGRENQVIVAWSSGPNLRPGQPFGGYALLDCAGAK
jgi:hypothetical protein